MFETSLFKEVYTKATKAVVEIISYSNTEDPKSISANDYNNVIAFAGERGTGKSSSMISFVDALVNEKSESFFNNYKELKSINCASLDIVDPSLFRDKDTLLEIVISKMFAKFQYELKQKDSNLIEDDKRELIKRFQKVFENLKTLNSEKSSVYSGETIELLSALAYGTNLKITFNKLVKKYLECIYGFSKTKETKNFLIVPIDDFDLNISNAYEMLEDLRQFLIQDNIIVCVACKVEQLNDAVEQKIRKEFKVMIHKDMKLLSDDPGDMASKYLFKLFPVNRRCYLPSINYSDTNINFTYLGEKINADSIENDILKNIYEATGFLFIKKETNVNYLIPRNLREFVHFFKFIYDLNKSDNEDESNGANREAFKSYFFNVWCYNNLNKKQFQILKELDEIDYGNKNKSLIIYLKKYYKDLELDRNKRDFRDKYKGDNVIDEHFESISDIENLENNSLNISFGDVLKTLNFYMRAVYDLEDTIFLSAIKIYYTIELTTAYKKNEDNAEKMIGLTIYPNSSRIMYNEKTNDLWTFELREIKDKQAKINELIGAFVISKKKDINRKNDEANYLYNLKRDSNNVIFSLLGFIRNMFFYESHFNRIFEKDVSESQFNFENEIIPFFSVDLIEIILNDMIFNKARFSGNYTYSEIINKQVISKIKDVLSEVDDMLASSRISLQDYFLQHEFIEAIIGEQLRDHFFQKINRLHSPEYKVNISEDEKAILKDKIDDIISKIFSLNSRFLIDQISLQAKRSYDHYNRNYFSVENYTSQGVRTAMSNMLKDFNDYPFIKDYLSEYRKMMNSSNEKGLYAIEYFLKQLANGQS
ncbi:MAG: hypothetical protein ACRBBL_20635 [Kordia sp.]